MNRGKKSVVKGQGHSYAMPATGPLLTMLTFSFLTTANILLIIVPVSVYLYTLYDKKSENILIQSK